MSTQQPTTCTRCGSPVAPSQFAGLCPSCLAAQSFATDTAAPDGSTKGQDPPPSTEAIAASLPQIEAIEFLGRGGMGVVYKARQKSLGRTVALKLLAPERLNDAGFATRFEREAKALAALNHPNIVTIYDFGKAGDFYYLLMEFIDGVNLRQAMTARRLTPEEALVIVPPICEALQYAHEHGIVHRDIKPENLLLDKKGRVKIADFGIAKMLGAEAMADFEESQPAGTPQYMAPEQKLHLQTDHRADIYSLGVVLYEMLTGELPTEKLQPPSKRVQVDVRIDEIVLRALESKPELRFPTAEAFRAQIQTATFASASSNLLDGTTKSPIQNDLSSREFSRYAVIGACWLAVSLVAFIISSFIFYMNRSGAWGASVHGPTIVQLMVLVPSLVFVVVGSFVTTICGWLAIQQIRTSKRCVRGLALAVFDLLAYPLIGFNCFVGLAAARLARMFVDLYGNHTASEHAAFVTRFANWVGVNSDVVIVLTMAVSVMISVIIVRSVWIAAERPIANTAQIRSTPSDAHASIVAAISLVLALISFVLGSLCAFWPPVYGAWPLMAIGIFMGSLAILMAIPMRRSSGSRYAIVIAGLGIAIWPLLAMAVSHSRSQTATAYQPPVRSGQTPQRGFPAGAHISRNHRSLLVTHDQVDPALHYVLFYEGDFGTSSTGTQNLVTNTWTDEGAIRLENGRSFGYSRHAFNPEELVINGTTWKFQSGRVFVLGSDGMIQQLQLHPSIQVASDPDLLAELIASHMEVGQPIQTVSGPDNVMARLQVRDRGEWSAEMRQLATEVGRHQADPLTAPEDLIHWGDAQGLLQAGVLMPSIVPLGSQVEARLVIRNATSGNLAGTMQLNGRRMQMVTREVSRLHPLTLDMPLFPLKPEVSISLRPGEHIELGSYKFQFGGALLPDIRECTLVSVKPGVVLTKFILQQPDGPALGTGETTLLVNDKFAAHSTVTNTLTFSLHHQLARNMEVALQQLIKGRPIQDAKASPDDKTLYVVAYNDVLIRVRTFVLVNDFADTIVRGDAFDYPAFSPLVAARSFFHACAIEDDDRAIANLLSVGLLAELRGERSDKYVQFKQTGVADPVWEEDLRGDWPGKRRQIRQLVDEWNRFALTNLREQVEHLSELGTARNVETAFLDAPVETFNLSVVKSANQSRADGDAYYINSLPPWWPINRGLDESSSTSASSSSQPKSSSSEASLRVKLGDARMHLETLQSQLAKGPVRDDLSAEELVVWKEKMQGQIDYANRTVAAIQTELSQALPAPETSK